jgi:hypothetical protein
VPVKPERASIASTKAKAASAAKAKTLPKRTSVTKAKVAAKKMAAKAVGKAFRDKVQKTGKKVPR